MPCEQSTPSHSTSCMQLRLCQAHGAALLRTQAVHLLEQADALGQRIQSSLVVPLQRLHVHGALLQQHRSAVSSSVRGRPATQQVCAAPTLPPNLRSLRACEQHQAHVSNCLTWHRRASGRQQRASPAHRWPMQVLLPRPRSWARSSALACWLLAAIGYVTEDSGRCHVAQRGRAGLQRCVLLWRALCGLWRER